MYYVLTGLVYLLSLLPFWFLYRISDLLYLLVYHVFRYRRKVVRENLRAGFPDLDEARIQKVSRAYFRNLCDMILETLKMISMSKNQLRRRFRVDLSLLEGLMREGRSCMILTGHMFNWEWANLAVSLETRKDCLVFYKPLSAKTWDRVLYRIRGRFGTGLLAISEVPGQLRNFPPAPFVCLVVADQNPSDTRRNYWLPFMNRLTSFYKGPELIARKLDLAVIFADIRKLGRGRYQGSIRLLAEYPLTEEEGRITGNFVRELERAIGDQPENWVWSHRRWKHSYPGPASGPGLQPEAGTAG